MLVESIRLIIVLAAVAGSLQLGRARPDLLPFPAETVTFVVTALGAGIGYVVGGVAARAVDAAMHHAESRLSKRHASEVLAATLGLVVGLALGALLSWPLLVLANPWVGYPVGAFVLIVMGAFGTRFAVRKRLEMFGVLGVSPTPIAQEGGCLMDASAAIDGRVLPLYRAGLLSPPLWVPSFILWELQGIADSNDPERRRRGRRGLDVLTSLREAGATVRVIDEDPAATTEPDTKLVIVARRRGLPIVTSDSNLAKAAEIQGVRVLNLHVLADLLRPPVNQGDRLEISLVKEGREPRQAVGYLEDGSMVVVEEADHRVGEDVTVEVKNVIQTQTGRLVFAQQAAGEEEPEQVTELADDLGGHSAGRG